MLLFYLLNLQKEKVCPYSVFPKQNRNLALNICIQVTQTGIQITSLKYFSKAVKDVEVQVVWFQVKKWLLASGWAE